MLHKFLLMVVVLAISQSNAYTQETDDEQTPLMAMLNLIPYDLVGEEHIVHFIDVDTAVATRLGTQQFANWNEFVSADEEQRDQWRYAVTLWGGGDWQDAFILSIFDGGEVFANVDVFQIERIIAFATTEGDAAIFQGDLDNEAIANAYVELGTYERIEQENYILLCSINGCDDGFNAEYYQPENPFGGTAARREAVALMDGVLLNAYPDTTLDTMVATYRGETSLLNNPDYAAVASALAERENLRRAYFSNEFSGGIPQGVLDAYSRTLSPEQFPQPMPAFNLVAIADTADDNWQYIHVILVYDNEVDAQTALPILQTAFAEDGPITVRRSHNLALSFDEAIDSSTELISASERTLVFLTMTFELTTTATPFDASLGSPPYSAEQFRRLVGMLESRDVLWLLQE